MILIIEIALGYILGNIGWHFISAATRTYLENKNKKVQELK